jgi:hypothetical protein
MHKYLTLKFYKTSTNGYEGRDKFNQTTGDNINPPLSTAERSSTYTQKSTKKHQGYFKL